MDGEAVCIDLNRRLSVKMALQNEIETKVCGRVICLSQIANRNPLDSRIPNHKGSGGKSLPVCKLLPFI